MSAVTTDINNNIFKKVYGPLENAVPSEYILDKEIPFSNSARVGERYVIGVVLSNESGITFAGTSQEAFFINAASAGVTKQAEIIPSQTILTSIIPFAFMSRSQGSEQAFIDGTKFVVKNHMLSHNRFLETIRLYGQAPEELGYVSYAASGTVYRGVTYTGSGTIDLTSLGGVAFTNGINAASKAILFAPGQFAAGCFVGLEGVRLLEIASDGSVSGSGKLVGVDADLGILYLDFVPTAPSATSGSGSQRICFEGGELAKEAVGIKKILTNQGSLFGISAASYSLWRSSVLNLGGKRFNLTALQKGVALGVNRGGLMKSLLILCNPRTFANLTQDEASLRKYDASYKSKGQNGFETIEYYAANGVNRIVPHPMVKEGDVFGLVKEDWIRSGSAEISFRVPGYGDQVIFPLENQAGYVFRTFADQFVLCQKPAEQIIWTNCNDEGVAYS